MTLASDDPRHGTTNGYSNHRCRCTDCREAHTAYSRRYRRRHGASPIVRLPAAPLFDAIPTAPPVSDPAMRRAWYRARTAGHITDRAADQLAAAYDMHPAEIWGTDWWADTWEAAS